VLATGKRCPNAALPGSPYCGLPAHQALAEREREAEEAGDVEPVEASAQAETAEAPAEEPEQVQAGAGEAVETAEVSSEETAPAEAPNAAEGPEEAQPAAEAAEAQAAGEPEEPSIVPAAEPEPAQPVEAAGEAARDQAGPAPATDDSRDETAPGRDTEGETEGETEGPGLDAPDQPDSVPTSQGAPARAPVVEQAPPETADEDSNEPDER
jgi:hypothetical protein